MVDNTTAVVDGPLPEPSPRDDDPLDPVGPPRQGDGRRLAGLAGRLDEVQTWVLGMPVLIVAFAGWGHRWVTDDAFINFRVVEMTLRGHLLSYNAGQRVEAGTSPLWIALLSLLKATLGWFIDIGWLAVLAGLALTLSGLVLGLLASTALVRAGGYPDGVGDGSDHGRIVLLLPAGLLVVAVLPPMWDFATSGLETGLTFAWIAAGFALVVARHRPGGPVRYAGSVWPLLVLGLGPLIRPDLAVLTTAFLAADVLLTDTTWWRRLRSVAIALAPPVAFELFRMAYFASLVPNTALAKEASEADWGRGLTYVDNLTATYALAVPAVFVAVWGVRWVIGARRGGGRPLLVLVAAPLMGGLVHGLYIVRVGGDFMHGRLLLPALFAVALSVGVLPLRRRPLDRTMAVCATGLVLWSAVCATEFRAEDPPPPEWEEIVDERAIWMSLAGTRHPITVDDYADTSVVVNGRRARARAERGEDVLVRIQGEDVPLPPGSGVVFEADTLGIASVAAGPDVQLYDRLGLANPLVARFVANPEIRIGHQKASDIVWLLARLGLTAEEVGRVNEDEKRRAVDAGHPDEPALLLGDPSTLAPAARALACPPVAELFDAIEAPLTPARALANLRIAVALTGRRFANDPAIAASCQPAR